MSNKSLTSTVLILIAIGLFYTFTDPQYQDVKGLRQRANDYQAVLEQATQLETVLLDLDARYRDFPVEEAQRLSVALPENVDAVRLALDLDTLAGDHGIALGDVQVEDADMTPEYTGEGIIVEDTSGSYEELNVTLSFISNYENFLSFLSALEQSLRIVDVESISFASSEGGLYNHQLTLKTYWLK